MAAKPALAGGDVMAAGVVTPVAALDKSPDLD
jgi:hypothetical protein